MVGPRSQVVPFWMITFDFADPLGRDGDEDLLVTNASVAAVASSNAGTTLTRSAVLFRIVKLLRMLKLARIYKASRVIQRVLLDIATNQWEWTFAKLKLIKLFTLLVIYAHWQV